MKTLLLAALLLAAPGVALAQAGADHSHGDMSALPPPGVALSTPAYEAAMDKMHTAMMALRITGNADADEIAVLIPHAQGAVDLARVELRYGTDPALQQLAREILAARPAEIARMQAWQAAHSAPSTGSPPTASPGAASPIAAAMEKMRAAMDAPESGEADRDFVRAMIPHHQGAIDLAQIELSRGTDPDLHDLARAILAGRTAEIARMQTWLAAHPQTEAGR